MKTELLNNTCWLWTEMPLFSAIGFIIAAFFLGKLVMNLILFLKNKNWNKDYIN